MVMISAHSDGDLIEQLHGIADAEVVEDLHPDAPSIWDLDPPMEGDLLNHGPNGIVLQRSGGHPAAIRYELWDTPPPEEDSWSRQWTGQIYFTSGQICALGAFEDDTEYYEVFDLGERDRTWACRVQWKLLQNETEPEFPREIVRVNLFKFQFWQ